MSQKKENQMFRVARLALHSYAEYLDFLVTELFDAAVDQEKCLKENGDNEFDRGWLSAFHQALTEAKTATEAALPWYAHIPVYTRKGMNKRLLDYVRTQLAIANTVRDANEQSDFNEGRAAAWENWEFLILHAGEADESGWVNLDPSAALQFLASSPNGTLRVEEVKPLTVRSGEGPDAITA